MALDPRTNAVRPDLAAKHLQGQVEARHFVEGVRHQVLDQIADVRREPAHEAALDTQALPGETVMVYETSDEGWCWGQLENDGYVGYLSANALGPVGPKPTHRISVPRTFGFPGADIKLPPMIALPMGATLEIVKQTERFALNGYGWHFPHTRDAADAQTTGFRRNCRKSAERAISLGRQVVARGRLLRPGTALAAGSRHRLPA